jgi:hypothetical protein
MRLLSQFISLIILGNIIFNSTVYAAAQDESLVDEALLVPNVSQVSGNNNATNSLLVSDPRGIVNVHAIGSTGTGNLRIVSLYSGDPRNSVTIDLNLLSHIYSGVLVITPPNHGYADSMPQLIRLMGRSLVDYMGVEMNITASEKEIGLNAEHIYDQYNRRDNINNNNLTIHVPLNPPDTVMTDYSIYSDNPVVRVGDFHLFPTYVRIYSLGDYVDVPMPIEVITELRRHDIIKALELNDAVTPIFDDEGNIIGFKLMLGDVVLVVYYTEDSKAPLPLLVQALADNFSPIDIPNNYIDGLRFLLFTSDVIMEDGEIIHPNNISVFAPPPKKRPKLSHTSANKGLGVAMPYAVLAADSTAGKVACWGNVFWCHTSRPKSLFNSMMHSAPISVFVNNLGGFIINHGQLFAVGYYNDSVVPKLVKLTNNAVPKQFIYANYNPNLVLFKTTDERIIGLGRGIVDNSIVSGPTYLTRLGENVDCVSDKQTLFCLDGVHDAGSNMIKEYIGKVGGLPAKDHFMGMPNREIPFDNLYAKFTLPVFK